MAMHVVLVCHTELDFDGTWAVCDAIQPHMEELFVRVADRTGKAVRTTFCVTMEFLAERLEEAFRLIERGHEVGVHSHLPGAHRPRHRYDGPYGSCLDEHGFLNQDLVSSALREAATALGLPTPTTRVGSMFAHHRSTIRVLESAGFLTDCAQIPGVGPSTHPAAGDFVLCDNSRRRCAERAQPLEMSAIRHRRRMPVPHQDGDDPRSVQPRPAFPPQHERPHEKPTASA